MSTRMDNAANEVIKAATECRFRETDEMCPRCQRDLEVYYCENRTFAVRCKHCEMVTLVQASNPHEAAEKVGLDIKNSFRRCGRWLPTSDENKKRCSVCDIIHLIAQYPHGQANYCPNCGAKMDLEAEHG